MNFHHCWLPLKTMLPTPVFPLSRKKRHVRHFFWTPADKNFENRHLQIWTQFLPQEKFHKTKFRYFFKNVCYIFSRFKPFSGHSMNIQQWAVKKVQTQFRNSPLYSFGNSPPPRFTEKVLYEFSRFMRPKTKVFALKFTHILKFSACKVYRKSNGRIFTIYASKKRNRLLRSSAALWKFSACKVYRKKSRGIAGGLGMFVS